MAAPSTQLVCPHCGSTLTFGMEIAAGAQVECLICMQSFAAAPIATTPAPVAVGASSKQADAPTMSDSTTASLPRPKPAPAAGVLVGKASGTAVSAKAPIPTAVKANPDTDLPTPARTRKPVGSPMAGKFALVAVALGLAFLLTGGIVFAIVKITAAAARPTPAKPGAQVAQNGGDSKPDEPAVKPDPDKTSSDPLEPKDQGSSNVVLSDEENEQLRNKIREEARQVLKRKPTVGGNEIDWQPVATSNVEEKPALGLTQMKINAAIDKGVAFLRGSQFPNGTWSMGHPVGHAAIGGLTLLECKVPPNDPAVQKSAFFVRSNIGNLSHTYELSLAILFLDRLGEARDRPLIQGMAMRLIAGQYDSGGWHYDCPLLTPKDMLQLYSFLHATKKPNLLDPLQGKSPAGTMADPLRDPNRTDDALMHFGQITMNPQNPPKIIAKGKGKGPAQFPRNPINPGNNPLTMRRGNGDNSNTQFALLALWAARRHDVPSDQSIRLAFQRFSTSQNQDFGWGYTTHRGGSSNTMTCVGLLGMAMGHGVNPEIIRFNPKEPKDLIVKPALQDQRIQNGLQALARNIGEPSPQKNPSLPMQNLYFLWSVERVAMLYDLKTIGGKDWYGWGAQILVVNQSPNGAWQVSNYPGANPPLNTCFALLFLKRSNLVQDLTNNLRLYSGIRDSEK